MQSPKALTGGCLEAVIPGQRVKAEKCSLSSLKLWHDTLLPAKSTVQPDSRLSLSSPGHTARWRSLCVRINFYIFSPCVLTPWKTRLSCSLILHQSWTSSLKLWQFSTRSFLHQEDSNQLGQYSGGGKDGSCTAPQLCILWKLKSNSGSLSSPCNSHTAACLSLTMSVLQWGYQQ